jgi:hypothetical protein
MDPRDLDLDSPTFFDFVKSIFYIGKSGFRDALADRPYSYIATQARSYPTTRIMNESVNINIYKN